MRSRCLILYFCLLALATLTACTLPPTRHPPAEPAEIGRATPQGCYSSLAHSSSNDAQESAASHRRNVFNSLGSCLQTCRQLGSPAIALQREACYCMGMYPPRAALVPDCRCHYPCPGYPVDACGGPGAFSVYNVGLHVDVPDGLPAETMTRVATRFAARTISWVRQVVADGMRPMAAQAWGGMQVPAAASLFVPRDPTTAEIEFLKRLEDGHNS